MSLCDVRDIHEYYNWLTEASEDSACDKKGLRVRHVAHARQNAQACLTGTALRPWEANSVSLRSPQQEG